MSDQRPMCECCGERAAVQDRDGVWLCEDDFNYIRFKARLGGDIRDTGDTEDTDE